MNADEQQDAAREQVHQAIQGTAGLHHHAADPGDPESKMLVGWIVVAEWMSPSGNRLLWSESGGSNGEHLPRWQRHGYLHSTLFPDWYEDDEEAPEES